MRALLLTLCLCAGVASAQNIGWAQCTHTQLDEKITQVRVYFLEGDTIYSYRTLKAGTTLKSQVLTFKETTREVVLTGMRLDCWYEVPNLKSFKGSGEPVWLEPITIPLGVAPKLGVLVDQSVPGITRVFIGKK